MIFEDSDKKYLNKLRLENSNRDIPSEEEVEKVVNKMKFSGSKKVIDDLIIRTFDGILELELI